MFKLTKKDRRKPIDKAMDRGLAQVGDQIDMYGVDSDVVERSIRNVKELSEIKKSNKPKINETLKETFPTFISTLGSIVCVLLIIGYEDEHIITTKSFPFIPKGRA